MIIQMDAVNFIETFDKWLEKQGFDGHFYNTRNGLGWFILARGTKMYLPEYIMEKFSKILIAKRDRDIILNK